MTTIWNDCPITWDQNRVTGSIPVLLANRYSGAFTASDYEFYAMNETDSYDGLNYVARIERTGLAIAGRDRSGQPKVDVDTIKFVRKVRLRVTSQTPGAEIKVQVGGELNLGEGVVWGPVQAFAVGSDLEVDVSRSMRFFAYRIFSESVMNWALSGLSFDLDVVGRY